MIKKAFTLIELIFVIVIIGIMAGVASTSFKTNYLLDDTNFIVAKIKEAQFLGIGYEHLDFGGNSLGVDFNSGCIDINNTVLEESATNANEVDYKLHVDDFDYGIICFDSKGRPHNNDFDGTLLTTQKKFTFKYADKEREIIIEPITGYIIINPNY